MSARTSRPLKQSNYRLIRAVTTLSLIFAVGVLSGTAQANEARENEAREQELRTLHVQAAPLAAQSPGEREREARLLYIQARKLNKSRSCVASKSAIDSMSLLFGADGIALMERTGIIASSMNEPSYKSYMACLKQRHKAAVIHQRILTNYGDTQVAFELAKNDASTPEEIERDIAKARSHRAAKLRQRESFQSLLKNLAQDRTKAENTRADAPANIAKHADKKPKRSALQARMMAASLVRAVNQQITPCWSIPAGAKEARNMSVAIRIRLNRDGTLAIAPKVEDTGRLGRDPSFRAVAESALRALNDPQCLPLTLPTEEYDLWNEISFVFDPSEALGR